MPDCSELLHGVGREGKSFPQSPVPFCHARWGLVPLTLCLRMPGKRYPSRILQLPTLSRWMPWPRQPVSKRARCNLSQAPAKSSLSISIRTSGESTRHPLLPPALLLMCDMTSNPWADSLPRPPAQCAQPVIKWEAGVHCCPNELIHLPALGLLTQNSTPPIVLLFGALTILPDCLFSF